MGATNSYLLIINCIMKKIIYSIFALAFILASCNNSSEEAHDHENGTHQHDDGETHDHSTHEHDNGEVHEDHDHHQEEFNVDDTLKK